MKIGKVSGNVLKRSVLQQLKTEREGVWNGAGIGEDCAILSFSDGLTVSCMQEAVLAVNPHTPSDSFSHGLPISVTHLIQRCVNNLAAAGAQPMAVLITLLLPESLEEPDLRAIMAEANQACRERSLTIAGGQTRVLRDLPFPVAVMTGLGKLHSRRAASRTARSAAPGQDIVISKWIGLEGTAFLARRYREKLLSRYPAHLVDAAAGFDSCLSVLPEAKAALEFGVCVMHDASEGGIFAALWELAEGAGVGLSVDIKKIPIRQETVEICEVCKINPYGLLSGGCLVMTAEDGPGLAAELEIRRIPAALIGKVTDGNDRILFNGDEIRYMDRPKTDEWYRILHESE